jgi:hypothetical protein
VVVWIEGIHKGKWLSIVPPQPDVEPCGGDERTYRVHGPFEHGDEHADRPRPPLTHHAYLVPVRIQTFRLIKKFIVITAPVVIVVIPPGYIINDFKVISETA